MNRDLELKQEVKRLLQQISQKVNCPLKVCKCMDWTEKHFGKAKIEDDGRTEESILERGPIAQG